LTYERTLEEMCSYFTWFLRMMKVVVKVSIPMIGKKFYGFVWISWSNF